MPCTRYISLMICMLGSQLRCLGSRPCYIIVLCSEARNLTSSVPLQTVREPFKMLGVEQRGEATYESPTSQEEKRYSQSHCATWPLRLELSHAMKITLPYASLLWHHLGLRVLTELFKVKGACTIQFIILSVQQFLFLRLKLDDNVNVSGSIFRR